MLRPACAALILLLLPGIARAQIAASVTLSSDERFRARSISRGEPAMTVSVAYDHPSGVYLGGAATASVIDSEPRVINVQGNIGYVHRTNSGANLDVGVVRSQYAKYSSAGRSAHYTELYAGVLTRRVAFYVRYSPDYFRPGIHTLYSELEGVVEPAPNWRLSAHAGSQVRLAGSVPPGTKRVGYDWRIAAARRIDAIELQLALSGGGPMRERYGGRPHDRTAVTVSLVWSL